MKLRRELYYTLTLNIDDWKKLRDQLDLLDERGSLENGVEGFEEISEFYDNLNHV